MGLHSLLSTSSLDWALLWCRPFLSCLAHILFFPMFVGFLLLILPCSYYIIISILFPCYLWAYRPMLLPVHFPHLFFFWALFDHIPAVPAHFIPWASSAYLLLLYLFYSHVFLLNLLGFLSPTNTSLPHITFRAYWPLNQPYKFTNSYLGLPGPFTSFLLLIIPIGLLLLHS